MRYTTGASVLATIVLAALAFTAVPAVARAQATYRRDIPDSLAKQAKITEEAAAKTAQRRVPNGTIQGVELEREKGKLIYSYDLKVAGKSGMEEVNVSAMTGKVVAREHESAAKVKKEAAEEKREAKPAAKKP